MVNRNLADHLEDVFSNELAIPSAYFETNPSILHVKLAHREGIQDVIDYIRQKAEENLNVPN